MHAAIERFAQHGYSGASTRAIARRAHVNDASLYRYFRSKHELFTAALGRALEKASAELDRRRRASGKKPPRVAVQHNFRIIASVVAEHRELTRLLQFAALEVGAAMNVVYRKHMRTIARMIFEQVPCGSTQRADVEAEVLAFFVTAAVAQNLAPLLATRTLPAPPRKKMAEICAEVWATMMVRGRNTEP